MLSISRCPSHTVTLDVLHAIHLPLSLSLSLSHRPSRAVYLPLSLSPSPDMAIGHFVPSLDLEQYDPLAHLDLTFVAILGTTRSVPFCQEHMAREWFQSNVKQND